ncbi:anion transporter [Chloroflexus sp. MS-CIW-1]|jgi:Na+/H+ antiporter NhaD/arsenite permease-like protein|uniref:anion transporter n=1 Tax=Chloroflexus sp. MS-CIW-1 TaxID=3055768 RepID=UPI002648A815|nr:anion transporter [Chloroflexus sp. MS-CIW-1]MDN5271781.1 anion transporter [Chloroflexus sp. MS-CIW-1]
MVIPVLTLLIVAATIIGIAVGRWPLIRADRTTIALIGSALLLGIGAISLEEAYAALDLDTILLLFGMMVINGSLFLSGFFGFITQRVVQFARGPRSLLALVIGASGVLSALFLNDTIVIMMTPIVLEVTRSLRRNPLPYLIGLAVAANIGSTATITGNPQNIIIGNASKIPYLDFAIALTPTALIGLVICWVIVMLVYRDEFQGGTLTAPDILRTRIYRPLLRKAALVISFMLIAFLIGVPVPLAAFLAAAILLTTRRLRPERVFKIIDWNLLTFFAGLFVVTHALDVQGWTERLFITLRPLAQAGMVPFGIVSVILSNLISNVPAVLLLQGLVPAFADQQRAWLTLAATATLAGNLTLLGSVANLIMAELAARWGVRVTFSAYLKVGLPVTILTVIVSLVLV